MVVETTVAAVGVGWMAVDAVADLAEAAAQVHEVTTTELTAKALAEALAKGLEDGALAVWVRWQPLHHRNYLDLEPWKQMSGQQMLPPI